MKDVAARFPALVTPTGEWCAVGWGRPGEPIDTDALLQTARECLGYDGPPQNLRLVWIKVHLPLPVPSEATVTAEANA